MLTALGSTIVEDTSIYKQMEKYREMSHFIIECFKDLWFSRKLRRIYFLTKQSKSSILTSYDVTCTHIHIYCSHPILIQLEFPLVVYKTSFTIKITIFHFAWES